MPTYISDSPPYPKIPGVLIARMIRTADSGSSTRGSPVVSGPLIRKGIGQKGAIPELVGASNTKCDRLPAIKYAPVR